MKINCTYCGYQIDKTERYCYRCGEKQKKSFFDLFNKKQNKKIINDVQPIKKSTTIENKNIKTIININNHNENTKILHILLKLGFTLIFIYFLYSTILLVTGTITYDFDLTQNIEQSDTIHSIEYEFIDPQNNFIFENCTINYIEDRVYFNIQGTITNQTNTKHRMTRVFFDIYTSNNEFVSTTSVNVFTLEPYESYQFDETCLEDFDIENPYIIKVNKVTSI